MKRVFRASTMEERLLCIDEGQDIPERCYLVLKELSNNECVFNIYGDLSQRIDETINCSAWDTLSNALDAKEFVLEQNYRNSTQIVQFYKDKLGRPNEFGFGLDSRPVESISFNQLRFWMQLHLVLKNRVAFITKRPKQFCEEYPDITVRGLERGKVNVLSVKEAKGLEFDTVFVDDSGFGENDKYIAYTRALSNLFICS